MGRLFAAGGERTRHSLAAVGSLLLASVVGCDESSDGPDKLGPDEALLGGDTTVFANDQDAFTHPSPTLDRDGERAFFRGRALFRDSWVAAPSSTKSRDGLGPLFNARSCIDCHVRDGRGRPPEPGEPMESMLVRLSLPGVDDHGAPLPDPTYGVQFQPLSIPGVEEEGQASVQYEPRTETYEDGETFELLEPSITFPTLNYGPMDDAVGITARVPRHMIGLGLLEAISEDDVLDGTGRPNWVWSYGDDAVRLGRFGWKASEPTVRQQAALAFSEDLGLTTLVFPEQACSAAQPECLEASSGGEPELYGPFLDDVTHYAQTLAVPAQRDPHDPQVVRGRALFEQVGCTQCHRPTFVTDEHPNLPGLGGQTIHPFTDLLLHDMGVGLADGRREFEAGERDWRTPPLWGIGLIETVNGHRRFLHDGRARGFAEAILWHDGEAFGVRENFRKLPADDRRAVIRFLESL